MSRGCQLRAPEQPRTICPVLGGRVGRGVKVEGWDRAARRPVHVIAAGLAGGRAGGLRREPLLARARLLRTAVGCRWRTSLPRTGAPTLRAPAGLVLRSRSVCRPPRSAATCSTAPAKDFLSLSASGVAVASNPSNATDLTVDKNGPGPSFTIVNGFNDQQLAVAGSGALTNGSAAGFNFVETTGCATFPRSRPTSAESSRPSRPPIRRLRATSTLTCTAWPLSSSADARTADAPGTPTA